MIRIALSSLITAIGVYAIHSAADTTPYIIIGMLIVSGFLAGALVMLAVLNDSEVK